MSIILFYGVHSRYWYIDLSCAMQLVYCRSCDKVTPHQTHIVGVTLTHFTLTWFYLSHTAECLRADTYARDRRNATLMPKSSII